MRLADLRSVLPYIQYLRCKPAAASLGKMGKARGTVLRAGFPSRQPTLRKTKLFMYVIGFQGENQPSPKMGYAMRKTRDRQPQPIQ
eukprot:364829-Chlamydomonas_euryale.AAC.8